MLRPYPDAALNHPWFRERIVRKSLKNLTINKNISHLSSRYSNFTRQRTILLKGGYGTGSSDGEEGNMNSDMKRKLIVRKSLFCKVSVE